MLPSRPTEPRLSLTSKLAVRPVQFRLRSSAVLTVAFDLCLFSPGSSTFLAWVIGIARNELVKFDTFALIVLDILLGAHCLVDVCLVSSCLVDGCLVAVCLVDIC